MTAYEKVYLMNTLIGSKPTEPNSPEFWQQIRNQVELVVEEVQETLDEAIDENLEALVGEVSDIMVTSLGLFQKLQMAGIPIEKILDRVCDKNLEKFHKTKESAYETMEFYREQDVETFVRMTVMEDGSEYYAIIRKSDGKMLKPKGFQKATFEDLVEGVGGVDESSEA